MDILGYKDYLKNHPDESEKYLATILNAIEHVKGSVSSFQNVVTDMFKIESGIKIKIFSDNILLCLPVKQSRDEIRRAIVFLLLVASIQRGLVLQHGLLIRGGVTIGELFINEDIVFGNGLIDAVSLEAQAEYPCIIVSKKTQEFLSEMLDDITEQYKKARPIMQKDFKKEPLTDEERKYLNENLEKIVKIFYYKRTLQILTRYYKNESAFINYLFDLSLDSLFGYEFAEYLRMLAAKKPKQFSHIIEVRDNIYNILLAHKDIVLNKVKENCNYNNIDKTNSIDVSHREKIIRKYIWLLRYHINMCEEMKFKQGFFAYQFGCDPNCMRIIIKVDD